MLIIIMMKLINEIDINEIKRDTCNILNVKKQSHRIISLITFCRSDFA